MSTQSYAHALPQDEAPAASALSSRRGAAILLLLCLVQFMDVLDASILNIALPSIRRDLDFTQQSLQWVVSGYILTYGGFLLLGGRAADLLGRRRILVSGLVLFAASSLAGGLRTAPGCPSPRAFREGPARRCSPRLGSRRVPR